MNVWGFYKHYTRRSAEFRQVVLERQLPDDYRGIDFSIFRGRRYKSCYYGTLAMVPIEFAHWFVVDHTVEPDGTYYIYIEEHKS